MKNQVSLAFALSLAAAATSFSARAALTAKSYVTDGLVWQLDGLENVGYGQAHNSGATKWYNLVGGGLDVSPGDSASFGDDSLLVTRAKKLAQLPSSTSATVMSRAYNATNFTIECSFNMTAATPADAGGWNNKRAVFLMVGSNGYKFGTLDDNKVGFCPNGASSSSTIGKTKSVDSTLGQHTLSCSQSGRDWTIRFDELAAATGTVTPSGDISTSHGIYVNGDYYTCGLNGAYHAFRFYNRALTADEYTVNRIVDRVRYFGASAADLASSLPDGWRFSDVETDVKLERRLSVLVEGGVGGTVLVNGLAPDAANLPWAEKGGQTEVALTATPADGYAFVCWSSDDSAVIGNRFSTTTTLTVGEDVRAVFRKTDGSEPRTYTAKGGTWDDPENWLDEHGDNGVPALNDSVVVPSGKTVLVSNSTPEFVSLTIAGTLSCTNWETCVQAKDVTVSNGGKITVAAKSTNQSTNRVWIVCDNLTVATGGAIDVNDLGFRSDIMGHDGGSSSRVAGPCRSQDPVKGASHGGWGGYIESRGMNKSAFQNIILQCDDPLKPLMPGSGGCPQAWGAGTAGGGAVYISAKKDVRVDGSIKASVTATVGYRGSGGAGGAVLIECETFHGSGGTITADGGNSTTTIATILGDGFGGATGGGGMIAIKYDPEKETADMVENMTISAKAGYYTNEKLFGDETVRFESGLGTVYFPDMKLMPALFGKGLSGALINYSPYVHHGDLVFNKGYLRLATEGAKLKVEGDLTVSGQLTRLDVGGITITNQCTHVGVWAGQQTNILEVTGAVTISDRGRLDLRAAETNANIAIGAYLKAGGAFTVAANSTLSLWSDQKNMGSPYIEADSFTLAEGGLVTGFMRGCGVGRGIGGGASASGGSHGGDSGMGTWSAARRKAYDSEYEPTMPGSGGGNGSWATGGPGGGVCYISVKGDAKVDGTIDVNGMDALGSHTGGGGAGGTIHIRCRNFSGASGAVMTAKGGNGKTNKDVGGGSGGGGGRIAVWTATENIKPKMGEWHFRRAQELPDTYLGTVNVIGGNPSVECATSTGMPGTVRSVYVTPIKGAMLILR